MHQRAHRLYILTPRTILSKLLLLLLPSSTPPPDHLRSSSLLYTPNQPQDASASQSTCCDNAGLAQSQNPLTARFACCHAKPPPLTPSATRYCPLLSLHSSPNHNPILRLLQFTPVALPPCGPRYQSSPALPVLGVPPHGLPVCTRMCLHALRSILLPYLTHYKDVPTLLLC